MPKGKYKKKSSGPKRKKGAKTSYAKSGGPRGKRM